MRKYVSALTLSFLLLGCASKKTPNQELEKETALHWHNEVYQALDSIELEEADEVFSTLESEFPKSPFIKRDMLALFYAHKNAKEFGIAKFYLDNYKKRYASKEESIWCEYQRIKLTYQSIENSYTNQKKLTLLQGDLEGFRESYPNSVYNNEIGTMLKKTKLTKKFFNQRISDLYTKLDKPKAAKLYKTDINNSKIVEPTVEWYKRLFYW